MINGNNNRIDIICLDVAENQSLAINSSISIKGLPTTCIRDSQFAKAESMISLRRPHSPLEYM